ncbi:hypothetical protein BS47DRAFT_1363737 [Hydnum rufescens UP504]|uniref:DUF6534 domain-containing protein n=1 Tax=Hydnum rufescens UP504 TaxID=1448309 RepID=A0A9P6ATD7_9AGAM|nr:hypothetical protein BS47DRAFT_1363737 [Hydnum rufescens UP504]
MAIMDVSQVNILAGLFLGILLTALCLGVLTVQASTYYNAFPNDARPLKLAVGLLCASCTQSVYRRSVANHNNPSALDWGTWESGNASNQQLSANIYIGVLVQALVLIQFGFGTAYTVKAHVNPEYKVIVKECTWLVVSWLAIQATADIVIAASMSLLLRHRRTGFQKTDSVINRMVLYTISTGLITSVLSCSLLAMFVTHGFHVPEVTFGMLLGVCYCITMLTNLHMRTRLRTRLATPTPLELIGSIKNRMRQNVGDHRNEARFQATRINITTVVVNDVVDMPPHIFRGPDFPNN